MNADAEVDCSVIIPAWNAESFIRGAIESAISQSGVNIEVIVIDDASSDSTCAIVEAIEDPRIRLVRRPNNGGAAAARNTGFRSAVGRWISVLDADDHMLPDRLRTLIALGDRETADIVADNLWVQDGANRHLHIEEPLDGAVELMKLEELYREARLFSGGREYGYLKPIFSSRFLKDHGLSYSESLPIGEDFQLLADALARQANFLRVRAAGYVYSRRVGSLSHRLVNGQLEAIARADQAFLDQNRSTLPTNAVAAIQARCDSVLTGEAFIRMLTALKSKALGTFISLAIQRPAALLLFRMPLNAAFTRLISR